LPQLTANHFLLMRLTAFPTETVSVVPAHVSVDRALAGRGDRYEHHFLVACRTTRENRWDAVRRYAYCRHVRTSLVPVCGGCPITTGGCKISFGRPMLNSNAIVTSSACSTRRAKSRIGGVASWPATANFPSRDHRNEFLQAEPSTFLHKRHAQSFHGARNIYRPGILVLRGA